MARARKLPSGTWRIRVLSHTDSEGKKHYKSFSADTKAECERIAADFLCNKEKQTYRGKSLTVGQAVDKYIELSQNLSPTTLQRYKAVRKYGFQGIMRKSVRELTSPDMQEAINKESKRISERTGKRLTAKTVKNEWGLISSALRAVCGTTYMIKLPKVQHNVRRLPNMERVLSAIVGSKIELPCMLAIWMSFSMSELRGIKCSSIHDGAIYIDQVVVDVDNKAIEKPDAKVGTRKRVVKCPDYIMGLIKETDAYKRYVETGEDGFIISMTRNQIAHYWEHICKDNDLDITLHDLRHIFASYSLNVLKLPEKVVQTEGGWSSPHIMKTIYSETFDDSTIKADALRDKAYMDIIQNITD